MPLWHKSVCAWITTDHDVVQEQAIYVDYTTDTVNCFIEGLPGQKFTIWWRNCDGRHGTSTTISLDDIQVPGKILEGEGTARRSGSRVSGNTERPFVFRDLVEKDSLDPEIPMEVGVIKLEVTRVKLIERVPASSLRPLPSNSVLGKRKAVDGIHIGFGEETLTVPRQEATWKTMAYEEDVVSGSPPRAYVTFLFRYRTRDYLLSRCLYYPPQPFIPASPAHSNAAQLVPAQPIPTPTQVIPTQVIPSQLTPLRLLPPRPLPAKIIPYIPNTTNPYNPSVKKQKVYHSPSVTPAPSYASTPAKPVNSLPHTPESTKPAVQTPQSLPRSDNTSCEVSSEVASTSSDPVEAANRIRQELLARLPANYKDDPLYAGIVQFLDQSTTSSSSPGAPSPSRKVSKGNARRTTKSRTVSATSVGSVVIRQPEFVEPTDWTGETMFQHPLGDMFDFDRYTDDSNTPDSAFSQ